MAKKKRNDFVWAIIIGIIVVLIVIIAPIINGSIQSRNAFHGVADSIPHYSGTDKWEYKYSSSSIDFPVHASIEFTSNDQISKIYNFYYTQLPKNGWVSKNKNEFDDKVASAGGWLFFEKQADNKIYTMYLSKIEEGKYLFVISKKL